VPGIKLTVSDNRESIIQNLKKRFIRAGIKDYTWFVEDLTLDNKVTPPGAPFSLVVADVPCTGSGTWGRTPEQLYFFDETKIEYYTSLQRRIISNVIKQVEPGGYFLYITCSVFSNENEKMAEYIIEQNKFELVSIKMLKGYENKADTLFAALFQLIL
jgi:16S rRNA (cytosine967-C5)-methyltransferase